MFQRMMLTILFLLAGYKTLLADEQGTTQPTTAMHSKKLYFEYGWLTFGYHLIDNHVYYVPMQSLYDVKFVEEDAKDFEILDLFYAKNTQFVYFKGKKLVGVDPLTFERLEDYTRDKNFIYKNNIAIKELDAKTFEIIDKQYTKDKNAVYYRNDKISGVDPIGFEVITPFHYIKNKEVVYYQHEKKLAGIDPESFEIINEKYTRDKNHVYKYHQKIDGSKSYSFKLIDEYYAMDENSIYYEGQKTAVSDPASFQIIPISDGSRVRPVRGLDLFNELSNWALFPDDSR